MKLGSIEEARRSYALADNIDTERGDPPPCR
jgi:hypothetical protein